MTSSIIKVFSILSVIILTLAGALLVWSMVVFLRNLQRWRNASTKHLNSIEASDYMPLSQREVVLPLAIISKIRELDEYRDVMTPKEWNEQIQLIIAHYFETQQSSCSNPIEGLEGSEVQKTINTLIRSRKEGVITKTTFEKKLYELLFKRKWPAG